VQKMAETVLRDIVPLLRQRLTEPDPNKRIGVCHCLKTVMSSASGNSLLDHMIILIPTVRDGLSDSNAGVRQACGAAFKVLYANVGTKALDRIIPTLLDKLKEPDQQASVFDALRIMWSYISDDADVNRMWGHINKNALGWSDGQLRELLAVLLDEKNGWASTHHRLIAFTNVVTDAKGRMGAALYDGIRDMAVASFNDNDDRLRECAMDTAALYLTDPDVPRPEALVLVKSFMRLLPDPKQTVRLACARHLKAYARACPQTASSPESLSLLVNELVVREKEDKNGPVKEMVCQALFYLLRLEGGNKDVLNLYKKAEPLSEALDLLYNRVLVGLKPE